MQCWHMELVKMSQLKIGYKSQKEVATSYHNIDTSLNFISSKFSMFGGGIPCAQTYLACF